MGGGRGREEEEEALLLSRREAGKELPPRERHVQRPWGEERQDAVRRAQSWEVGAGGSPGTGHQGSLPLPAPHTSPRSQAGGTAPSP